MTKRFLLVLALVPVVGCNSHSAKTNLQFAITPDAANHTLSLDCKASSSDTCHFAFTEGITPTEVALKVGDTIVLHGDTTNALYCAEITQPAIETCTKTSIASNRRVVTKRSSTDETL